LFGDKRDYLRGFGYQGGAGRSGWSREIPELTIGAALKDALAEPGGWGIGFGGFGETLPYHENKITLDKTRKDKWGLNVLAIDVEYKENEIKMRKDMADDAVEMLTIAGAKNVQSFTGDGTLGRGIHEMGSARMGKDAKASVLNGFNQVWDAPNVFVTDGSFMTSAGCQNPSLTYMAFTARAANHAVSELKKGNL
jgi:choline dehydrogenase-like flavoprotein